MAFSEEKFFTAIRDLNGPGSYDKETAAVGFIEDWEKLQIQRDVLNLCVDIDAEGVFRFNEDVGTDEKGAPKIDPEASLPTFDTLGKLTLTQDQKKAFLAQNFKMLTEGSRAASKPVSDQDAAIISQFRLHMVEGNYLAKTQKGRYVKYDEVAVNEGKVEGEDAAFDNFLKATTADSTKMVFFSWSTWAAMNAHVFFTRGHHWTDELDGLYDRLWKACDLKLEMYKPAWSLLMRTAIHAFGVFRPYLAYRVRRKDQRLPGAFDLRTDASPAGTALVTTSAAVVRSMMRQAYYKKFYDTFKEQVDGLMAEAMRVSANREQMHQNRSLYGVPPAVKSMDREAALRVVSFLVGYLRTLPPQAPITNQQALNKPAMDAPDIVQRVERFITGMGRDADSADTFDALMKALQG